MCGRFVLDDHYRRHAIVETSDVIEIGERKRSA
jgi:hypothetical protein